MTTGLLAEVRARRRFPPPAMARAIRITAGVSQGRIAEELGVDRATVTRWENGRRRPRGRLAIAYADLLGALQAEIDEASA